MTPPLSDRATILSEFFIRAESVSTVASAINISVRYTRVNDSVKQPTTVKARNRGKNIHL